MIYVSIVEDLEDVSLGISREVEKRKDLKMYGRYSSAEEALQHIPGSVTNLVLMDIGLPKMNGIECLVRLKEQNPQLDFLMFTVFDADEQLFDALRFGASGYILKSDGIRGVMKAIDVLAAGGAPMSNEIARKVLNSMRQKSRTSKVLEKLTPKQNEVLQLLADGLFNFEIADRMGITNGTVNAHLNTIYKKLHVNNRVEAVNKYLRSNDG